MHFLVTTLLVFILFVPTAAVADTQTMDQDLQQRLSKFHAFLEYTGRTLVDAASDSTFQEFFLSTDPIEKGRLKHKIDFLSLNTQTKFKVDEMCLIDKKGQEISRVVYSQIAPSKDLSSEEASAPFFNPAFSKSKGEYHVSAPYMSADSLRWVLCFATPIVLDDGSKPAIYHYEMSQYVFQGILNQTLSTASEKFLLVFNEEGYVVSDSRKTFALEFNVADTEMKTPFSDYFPRLADDIPSLSGLVDSKGQDISGDVYVEGKDYTYLTKPVGYNDWQAILFYPK
jgi:hypothetical protein